MTTKELAECSICGGDACIGGATFALRTDKPPITLCRKCLDMIVEMELDGPELDDDAIGE